MRGKGQCLINTNKIFNKRCQEKWTGAAKSLQSCPILHDPIDGSLPGSPIPGFSREEHWSCHFLLQCMKVKSKREVTQSCPISSDPIDCSLPGSSIHGIFQARVLKWVAIAFSGNVPLVSFQFSLEISSLSHSIFFPLFLCIDRPGRLSYLSMLFFGTLHSDAYIFPFLLCFCLSSFHSYL